MTACDDNWIFMCVILSFFEQWENALVVAPAVSLSYWKSLAERFDQILDLLCADNINYLLIVDGRIS